MSDTQPIYNSKITKVYLEYLKEHYPGLDVESLLAFAGMQAYEVADPNHWFSQDQADRFNKRLVELTEAPDIARKAGRYATSAEGMGTAKRYLLGLLNLSTLYQLIGKVYLLFSRGASVKAKKLGPNKIELISRPKNGVNEKAYQCEYRIGMFESVARYFIKEYAQVEHPECFHEGQSHCRYIITWGKSRPVLLRQVRNLYWTAGIPVLGILAFMWPVSQWGVGTLAYCCGGVLLAYLCERAGLKEVTAMVETKGEEARELIEEMDIRHENALLVQAIGEAITSAFDVKKLIEAVLRTLQQHAEFDRGVIFLADKDKTTLSYVSGYGYGPEKEALLKSVAFNLANPKSKGEFVLAFRHQQPFLVDDVTKIEGRLSGKSIQFIKDIGVQSLICVPIVYKGKSIGILSVDNIRSKRPLLTSDINLLMGVASQTAIGIMNAMAFQKLQESEKKYRELVENANSIIMRIDTKGAITFFNEYAQRVFGYNAEQIIGQNVRDMFHILEDTTRSHLDELLESMKQFPEKTHSDESRNILKNGQEVWTVWTFRPVFNKNNDLVEILCIGNDITERKQAELDKHELQTRLQRSEKMEALGTLAGGVAHDLNNILSGIVSYPQVMLNRLPEDSNLRKPVLTIQNSGKRAAAIVQDLLTLARRGVISMEDVDLNTVVSDYLKSPEYRVMKKNYLNVNVQTVLEEDILNITGSPVHLSKTVMNLVTNAIEAIDTSGKVTVTTENKYVDDLINGYDQVANGDYVTLSVVDNGCGISKRDLERIFEPFYSKKVMGKSGTGLGMAVVWGTVKDHSGYIDVRSEVGQGSRFTLYFPAARKTQSSQAVTSESIDDFMAEGESVLVVDDIAEQREIASEMLEQLGYVVHAVASGEAAVEYLQEHAVDLLVLDMIMPPGMDGLDTYKQVLQIKPNQKAVITSGFAETARVKEALSLGAGAYVKKPYMLETIGHALRAERLKG